MSRSRSRDSFNGVWGHPEPDRPHDADRTLSWHHTPALRNHRRVLVLVELDEVRHVLEDDLHSDAMFATRSNTLPNLDVTEERGLFTFARLFNPSQLPVTTSSDLISGISQYIFDTWGVHLASSTIGLRWTDPTDDMFQLRDEDTIAGLLRHHRPNWARAQDTGILTPSLPFTFPTQPYVMRMSCHRKLPPHHLP